MTSATDRFMGDRHPLLAALATNAARPSAALWVLGAAGLGSMGLSAFVDAGARPAIATGLVGVLAVAFAFAAPVASAQQIFLDRQGGALDQHRLAGRSPAEVLASYVFGSTWAVLMALWVMAVVATGFASAGARGGLSVAPVVPLIVASIATAAGYAMAVGGVALALGIDRNLPAQQGAGVGVLGPILRLPLYGFVFAMTNDRGGAGMIAAELLALALSARFALRRLAREDEDLDDAPVRYAAMVGAAGVAAMLGAAHATGRSAGLVFPVIASVALMAVATSFSTPSRAALFRASVAGRDVARGQLGASVVASLLAGLGVFGASSAAATSMTVYAAAGLAAAVTMSLRATGLRHAAGEGATLRGVWIGATLGLPTLGTIAAAVTPDWGPVGYGGHDRWADASVSERLARFVGSPFEAVTAGSDLALRLAACAVFVVFAGWTASRSMRAARERALAKVAG